MKQTLCALALFVALSTSALAATYAGTYTTTRPGADAMQKLTLVLSPDGSATLTTSFPGYTKTAAGTPVFANRESGLWKTAGSGVLVSLTSERQVGSGAPSTVHSEHNVMQLSLAGCKLTAVTFASDQYGSNGLSFSKAHCP